ncbi:MAG TPA: hypothetical protein ENO22_00925 [candidate division Zixibacteria bacterium]|mgnify:CR=1 FL=1|nr:hypothetical protein [candidate division Zixibacteria bacterium]HEQ97885.1 hypothetical protein [candidate division Zixibacteria bacterium]
MNAKAFSRLSVGATYRFDIKKALFSQAGALFALVMAIISEGNPPFGDEPYRLFSPVTFFLAVNVAVLVYTLIALGSSWIKLYPSMMIYTSRGDQTRIDFARVTRVVRQSNKELSFYITDHAGKETLGLKIKNYAAYANSEEMLTFLKYLLGDKFSGHIKPEEGQEIDKDKTKAKEDLPPARFKIPNRFFRDKSRNK